MILIWIDPNFVGCTRRFFLTNFLGIKFLNCLKCRTSLDYVECISSCRPGWISSVSSQFLFKMVKFKSRKWMFLFWVVVIFFLVNKVVINLPTLWIFKNIRSLYNRASICSSKLALVVCSFSILYTNIYIHVRDTNATHRRIICEWN